MRIRGYDEETEQLSEDLVNIKGDVIDLTKTADNPDGISLFTDASQTQYKDIGTYLHEISEIYDDLGAKQQQTLLEKLFGKNRASVGAAILSNMDAYDKAIDNMENSAGNAEAEMAVASESISFHLNALKETWVGVAQSLFDRGALTAAIDGLTLVSNGVKLLVDNLGLLGSIGAGAGIFALIKNLDSLKAMGMISTALSTAPSLNIGIQAAATAISGFSEKTKIAAVSAMNLSRADTALLLGLSGLSDEAAAAAAAQIAAGRGADATANRFKNLGAQIKNVGKGLGSFVRSISTTGIGVAALGVGLGLAIIKIADLVTTSFDEAKDKAEQSRNEYENTISELGSLDSELETTQKRINELEAKKSLSLTDEAELGKLRAQNDALQAQYNIKKSLSEIQQEAAANDARAMLTNKNDKEHRVADGVNEHSGETRYRQADIIEYTKDQQRQLDAVREQEKKIIAEQNKRAITGQKPNWRLDRSLSLLQEQETSLANSISENMATVQTGYESLLDADGNVIAGNEAVAASCEELFQMVADSSDVAKQVENDINTILSKKQFDGVKDSLVDAAKNGDGAFDKALVDVSGLSSALEQAGISADDFKQYIQAIADADLGNIDNQVNQLMDTFSSGSEVDSEIESRITKFKELMNGATDEQKTAFIDYIKNNGLDVSQWSIEDLEFNWKVALLGAEEAASNVDALKESLKSATTDVDNLNKAMSESASATGLSRDSIENLENMFSDYDTSELFERTANGVRLNADELDRLNSLYESDQAAKYQEQLVKLNDQLESEKSILAEMSQEDENYTAQIDTVNNIQAQIDEVQLLASEWEGATSAYNKYVQAQSGGNQRDSFESVAKGKEEMQKLIDQGWFGDDSLESYLDLTLGKDRPQESEKAWEKLSKTIEGTSHSLSDYFTFDDGNLVTDGLFDFVDDVNTVFGDTYAGLDEKGNYFFNLTGSRLQEVADRFGTTTEMIELMGRAMEDAGMKVNFNDAAVSAQQAYASIEEAKGAVEGFKSEGAISQDLKVDFDIESAPLDEVKANIDALKTERAQIDVKANPEAAHALDDLIAKCQQEYLVRLNVETNGSVDTAVQDVQKIQDIISAAQSANPEIDVKAFVTGNEEIQNLASELSTLPPEVQTQVGIKAENTGNIDGIISQLSSDKNSVTVPVNYAIDSQPDEPEYKDQDPKVKYHIEAPPPPVYRNQFPRVKYNIIAPSPPTYNDIHKNVVYHVKKVGGGGTSTDSSGGSGSSGTFATGTMLRPRRALADGTMRNVINWKPAYANGKIALNKDEEALVNEVGTESLVRNGQWMLIPGGMHIEKLKKGDIILNAAQTKSLLKNGEALGRGKAYANGTLANAYVAGSGGRRRKASGSNSSSSSSSSSRSSSSRSSSNASNSRGSSRKSSSSKRKSTKSSNKSRNSKKTTKKKSKKKKKSSSKKEKEYFDWIETLLNRVERKIKRLDKTASNIYKKTSTRNKALKKEMSAVSKEITLQEKGYNRYIKAANKVGLSGKYKKLVQNGAIDIDGIKDEKLQKKIKQYQEWYDKALGCKDAIQELKEKESELIKQRFDNTAKSYDQTIERINTFSDTIQSYIDLAETRGHQNNSRYFRAIMGYDKKEIDKQKKRRSALQKQLDSAVLRYVQGKNGGIAPHSEAWYEMRAQIDETTKAIVDCTKDWEESANKIRQIEWDRADFNHQSMSNFAQEATFLAGLIDDNDLYDEKGTITAQGRMVQGLHAQNYNTYMRDADAYAKDIATINRKIAKDGKDKELLDRRKEIIESQQKSIEAARQEQEALRDLAKKGVDKLLSSLKDLIDKYTESLDKAKSLYDYQKSMKEKSGNITSLQKQLSAYEGDTSEESRQRVQKLRKDLSDAQNDLRDTQYDRYISDTKELLNNFYSEYEETLNKRVDDITLILQDGIDAANTNANTISDTIKTVAKDVGYTISDAMKNSWNVSTSTNGKVVDTYNKKNFYKEGTSTRNALRKEQDLANDVYWNNKQDNQAKKNISKVSDQGAGPKVVTTTPPKPKSSSTEKKNSTKSTNTSKLAKKYSFFIPKSYSDAKMKQFQKAKKSGKAGIKTRLGLNSVDYSDKALKKYYVKMGLGKKYTGTSKQNQAMIKWLNKRGFSKGVENLPFDQFAWTQERAPEAIIRRSDNALLTPLKRGDSVLNRSATANIWDMANNPADFIRDQMRIPYAQVHSGGDTIHNAIDLEITLPNVSNYQDFMNAARSDPKFEKLIQAMTTERLAGKSSKVKNSIKW